MPPILPTHASKSSDTNIGALQSSSKARSRTVTERLSLSGIRAAGMEHLWSQTGATGGKRSQMGRAHKRLK